jgi:general secretion pathway protein D
MSTRNTRLAILALLCVLAGRLAVADAGPGKQPDASPQLTQVVYPVADLVVPIDMGNGPKQDTQEDRLVQLVSSAVAPASWKQQGGPGTLQYHPHGMALVVVQTPQVHEQVVHLLKALRRLQEVEVAVELRVVTVSPEMAAEFRTKNGLSQPPAAQSGPPFVYDSMVDKPAHLGHGDASQPCSCAVAAKKAQPKEKPAKAAVLTDKELYLWLRIFQNDPAANIMMSPKVTVFDGQQACVNVGQMQSYVTEYRVVREGNQFAVVPNTEQYEVGTKCTLLPVVSADRRFVRLDLDMRMVAESGSPGSAPVLIKLAGANGEEKEFRGVVQQPRFQTLSCKQKLNIPDCHTIAIPLGETSVETRTEIAVPVLKDVPFVRHLFARTIGYGREQHETFLFVTPRIIVNEEDETAFHINTQPAIATDLNTVLQQGRMLRAKAQTLGEPLPPAPHAQPAPPATPPGILSNPGHSVVPPVARPTAAPRPNEAKCVRAQVDERPPLIVGRVIIIGNKATRDEVILRAIDIYPGQVLRLPELRLAERNLARLGIFEMDPEKGSKPSVVPIDTDDPTVKDILVTVQEAHIGRFQIGAGFNTDNGLAK